MRKVLPVFVMIVFLVPVLAQTLTLTPKRLELLASPSDGVQGSASLSTTGQGVAVEVATASFLVGLEGNFRYDASHERDLCPYLEVFPQGSVELSAGGSMDLWVKVRPFQGEGTYWCMVLLQTAPTGGGQGGLGISARIAVGLPVYVTFQGTERPKLTIEGLGRDKEELKVLLANKGNVFLRVSGTLFFYDKDGKEVLRLPLSDEGVAVFPGGKRLLTLKPGLPPSGYKVLVLLEHAYGRLAGEGRW